MRIRVVAIAFGLGCMFTSVPSASAESPQCLSDYYYSLSHGGDPVLATLAYVRCALT